MKFMIVLRVSVIGLSLVTLMCCNISRKVSNHTSAGLNSAENDSLLPWSASRKLMVSDFRRPAIDSFKPVIAESALAITYEFKLDGNYLRAKVYPVFLRYKSWSVAEDTIGMLNHEQRHFDIEEIACRMVRKELSNDHNENGDLHEQWTLVLTGIGFHRANYLIDEQKLYDRRTNHGTYPDKQLQWDRYIDSMLNVYKDYADPTIVLPISDTIW